MRRVPPHPDPLPDEQAVAAAAGGDLLACWAAQVLRRGGRAWAGQGAVAVAGPDLQRRDRLVVTGDPAAAVGLVAAVLPELPAGLRLTADPDVVFACAVRDPHPLVWREARGPDLAVRRHAGAPNPVEWLPRSSDDEVDALFDAAAPDSWGRPGEPRMLRYAGVREADRLVAVAGEGWSAPGVVGYLAGVATLPGQRGRGLATGVCAVVTADLLARHGAAALLHDAGAAAAARVYDRLGYARRPLLAGSLPG